ncbi:hypothetical protein ACEWY4_023297 [Coilia grayii]|uniref:Cordon-bleu ubiquitin-like domain-containing protein n=1 Tax=Coilia grayii TaxID=363190 RepID=A0ABD1J3K7_9TELE
MEQQQQQDPLERDLTLLVVLPDGTEKNTVVHGSKPMMDLLVTLCAQHHLNPSGHTIELFSKNHKTIKFKPNALIGALEAEKILLKPKGLEEKNKKAGPQMPEATVRVVINYRKTQKTILRVSPKIPLMELLPAISEKCEFDVTTTILLRNVQSNDPLDLTHSLNDLGIREVYARDTKATSPTELPPSPTHSDTLCLPSRKDKSQKERENKENKGLFSLFRRSRKKSDQPMTASAPASPILRKQRPVSMCALPSHTSSYNSNTMPSDVPKKRRAPLPPTMRSPEATPNPGANQEAKDQSPIQADSHQSISRASLSESSLKRTKRKAPPPPSPTAPSPSPPEDAPEERSVTGIPLQATLENIREQEESPPLPAPAQGEPGESVLPPPEKRGAPAPKSPSIQSDAQGDDSSSLNLSADVSMDSGRAEASSPSHDADMLSLSAGEEDAGEDQSCDLSSHGKLGGSVASSEENGGPAVSREAQVALESEDDVFSDNGMSPVSTQEATAPEEIPESSADLSCSPEAECSPAPPSDDTGPSVAGGPLSESESEGQGSQAASSLEDNMQGEISCTSSLEVMASTPMASSTPEPEPQLQPTPPPSAGLKRDMATSTEKLNSLETQEAVSPVPSAPTHSPTCTPEPAPALAPSPASVVAPVTSSAPSPAPVVAPAPAVASAQAPATAKGGLVYATDSKPKPKPSNEVTRDYIPKLGMTTYTIVPQKSLEKLRYFEVELTLEAPPDAAEPEVSAGPAEAKTDGAAKSHDESATTAPPADAWPDAPEAELTLRNGAESSDSSAKHSVPPPQTSASTSVPAAGEIETGGGRGEESEQPLSPVSAAAAATVAAAVAAAAGEVKEKKVPPATKPKPASFRLPQHKRTPGYYVTSAAVKCAGGHKEAVGGQLKEHGPQAPGRKPVQEAEVKGEEEEGDALPPPPPPPLQELTTEEREQEGEVASVPAQPIQNLEDARPSPSPSLSPIPSLSSIPSPSPITSPSPMPSLSPVLSPGPSPVPSLSPVPNPSPVLSPGHSPVLSPIGGLPDARLTRQGSLPSKNQPPSPGLSLEKLRSFAAPKPYSPTSPSRFAQAVSSAIKRTNTVGHGPAGQTTHKVPLHPLAGHSPIRELTEPSKNTVGWTSHSHVPCLC